ncbi:T-complex 11 [Plasmopara halstedii]|uniref:T-complex 11 n=1 Tax=Plasmopara halstedii TaxID=4781 RepID=A0A0P1AW79_PLAHL|nr:T-complex 11 [Plasmopara halstedii]CEG45829.1 T-complex 11 [Plasmopara halstedii]|eukprot:XP_024582198.1 T-complex 11 [Plasmopara halstedii]
MGNKSKSKCQIRLEARSRANCALAGRTMDPELLAAELQSRIARANEIRAIHTRQLATRARARVQHAQDVARGMRVKRHEEIRNFRQSSVLKLDEATRRRNMQLLQLQLQCKQRTDLIQEKVELVRLDQSNKAAKARRALMGQLNDAARRRHQQTQQLVRRLNERWQSVESVKDRVARVKFIQRWYRRQVVNWKSALALQHVQHDVKQVVQCWTQMKVASFDECMKLVQQRPVVKAAQRLVHVLTGNGHMQISHGTKNKIMSVRVLMMAGMISCHPNAIMEKENLSKRLHYAGNVIVMDMEHLALCLAAMQNVQRTHDLTKCVARLSARFAFYTETFARWKTRDAQRLASELLVSYREVVLVCHKYELQAQVAHDGGDGVHELLRQTQRQLVQMQQALERLLGLQTAKEKIAELMQQVNATGTKDTQIVSEKENITMQMGTLDEKNENVKMHESNVQQENGTSVNATLLTDVILVHELILNPQYQIVRDQDLENATISIASSQSVAAVAIRIRNAMTKAFWDQIVQSNDVRTLIARTDEVRTAFRNALAGGTGISLRGELLTLANEVDCAFNSTEFYDLMQDPDRNMKILQSRCNSVLDCIECAEAPARIVSTREFRNEWTQKIAANALTPIELLVTFLMFVMDKMDELRIDVLNAHFKLLATYLQQHGVAYEEKRVQARLGEFGSIDAGYPKTIKWLTIEMEAYVVRSIIDEMELVRLAQYNGTAFKRFVRTSIWALVEKHIDGTESRVWPETFELDVSRIRTCRDTLDRITVVLSLVALVQEYAVRRHLIVPTIFFQTLSHQLNKILQSPGISKTQLAAQASHEIWQFETRKDDEIERKKLNERLVGAFAADNPVFHLFFSRVARTFETAVRSESDEDVKDFHPSLTLFADEMIQAISTLRRLVKHNERVYAALYNSIIKRLV